MLIFAENMSVGRDEFWCWCLGLEQFDKEVFVSFWMLVFRLARCFLPVFQVEGHGVKKAAPVRVLKVVHTLF